MSEPKEVTDKLVDDIARRCLPLEAYEAVVLRGASLLITWDPDTDFKVEVIPYSKLRAIEAYMKAL